tara:strand:+ start:141 stop:374 length:234 start_codon:yes stop_codon:yes gene_type:complete
VIITCVNFDNLWDKIILKNMNKRIRLVIGVVFIIGALFGGLVGYDLRSVGQQYNHIWVLSIISLYAGFDWISKSLNE